MENNDSKIVSQDIHRTVLLKNPRIDLSDLVKKAIGLGTDAELLNDIKRELGILRGACKQHGYKGDRHDILLKPIYSDEKEGFYGYVTDTGKSWSLREKPYGASCSTTCFPDHRNSTQSSSLEAAAPELKKLLSKTFCNHGESLLEELKYVRNIVGRPTGELHKIGIQRFTKKHNDAKDADNEILLQYYFMEFCFKLTAGQQIHDPYELHASPSTNDKGHYILYVPENHDIRVVQSQEPFFLHVEIYRNNFGTDKRYEWKLCGMKFKAGADPDWKQYRNPDLSDIEISEEILLVIDALYYANDQALTVEDMDFSEEVIKAVAERCNIKTDLLQLKEEHQNFIRNAVAHFVDAAENNQEILETYKRLEGRENFEDKNLNLEMPTVSVEKSEKIPCCTIKQEDFSRASSSSMPRSPTAQVSQQITDSLILEVEDIRKLTSEHENRIRACETREKTEELKRNEFKMHVSKIIDKNNNENQKFMDDICKELEEKFDAKIAKIMMEVVHFHQLEVKLVEERLVTRIKSLENENRLLADEISRLYAEMKQITAQTNVNKEMVGQSQSVDQSAVVGKLKLEVSPD
jgi:hypothetical protein